jgi:hypothetical protein
VHAAEAARGQAVAEAGQPQEAAAQAAQRASAAKARAERADAETARVREGAARERDELRAALEARVQVLEESRSELRGRAERELEQLRQGIVRERTTSVPLSQPDAAAWAARTRNLTAQPLHRTSLPGAARVADEIYIGSGGALAR